MRVSLDRVRAIFGYAGPPATITEQQFDYCEEGLERLVRTPIEEIDPSDLWYYFHDLAYVPLQPDLFAYLFPVCLWDWHVTLMANESCSHGDSEFHSGVVKGNIFDSMLSPDQRLAVFAFLRDSMLDRLDEERGFVCWNGQKYPWQMRWNSLGLIMPQMETLWDEWGKLASAGHAVAAIEYICMLMYLGDENPLFDQAWSGRDSLTNTDSEVWGVGWSDQNVDFVRRRLTVESIRSLLDRSVQRLSSEPEFPKAQQIKLDFPGRVELVESRLSELPAILKSPGCELEWSV